MTKNVFWDSCVFIAYLNNEEAYRNELGYISNVLGDSTYQVFTSGIALAEISPKKIRKSDQKTFTDFINLFKQKIVIIPPGPNICTNAGMLKDYPYSRGTSNRRVLTTGDAIMLATALELTGNSYGIELEAFHTFDNGRGKGNPEGRGVPLLDYHLWVGENPSNLIQEAINLNRCRPRSPNLDIKRQSS